MVTPVRLKKSLFFRIASPIQLLLMGNVPAAGASASIDVVVHIEKIDGLHKVRELL
jgi:hypothetical protein